MFRLKTYAVFLFLFINHVSAARSTNNSAKVVFRSGSDLNIGLIFHKCENFTTQSQFSRYSLLSDTAIWTIERLNFLELTTLQFGLSMYETCTVHDDFSTIFHLYEQQSSDNGSFLLGIISDKAKAVITSTPIARFCDLLEIELKSLYKSNRALIKASVLLIKNLNWQSVRVLVPNQLLLRELFEEAKKKLVCIKDFTIYDKYSIPVVTNSSEDVVLFGYRSFIESFILKLKAIPKNLLLVPLDGSILNDLPGNSYIITPPFYITQKDRNKTANFFPSPIFFEIAIPLTNLAQNIQEFIVENCNETGNSSSNNKETIIDCLQENAKNFQSGFREIFRTPMEVLEFLKIEPLSDSFFYNIFKTDNSSYNIAYQYNIFNETLTSLASSDLIFENNPTYSHDSCECKNFASQNNHFILFNTGLQFRKSESWIFVFLSLSLLGVLISVAILIFLASSLCHKDILEGNPVLTIILLIVIILMYCSIIPIAFEGDRSLKELICLVRVFSITLTFAAAFSLMLSRAILLASASKEVGILSHISGSVQSFLCLFIFGVQAALTLQILNRCIDIYNGITFIYFLSYNSMLLLLLLCLAPLIFKSQRNYREGKYFSISVLLISILWCVWIPCYALLGDSYKEPVLAFGVFSTASILLGVIFIPRTYLMTIARTRNQITSNNLPSSSALDIYRAATQPIYDSVNVEAINSLAISRSGYNVQQPDLYSFPTMTEDEHNFENSLQQLATAEDKVTRF